MMLFATELLWSESSPQDGTRVEHLTEGKAFFLKNYGNLEWHMMILCIV